MVFDELNETLGKLDTGSISEINSLLVGTVFYLNCSPSDYNLKSRFGLKLKLTKPMTAYKLNQTTNQNELIVINAHVSVAN
jgi:hypothetical protein